jgi:hypothetical protein
MFNLKNKLFQVYTNNISNNISNNICKKNTSNTSNSLTFRQNLNARVLMVFLLLTFCMTQVAAFERQHSNILLEVPPIWNDLTPLQQHALKPMQLDWARLDSLRKQKWLTIAERYHTLPSVQKMRIHERMTQWNQLSDTQRHEARDNYLSILSSTASVTVNGHNQLHEQWIRYQALPPEARAKLREQAKNVEMTKMINK